MTLSMEVLRRNVALLLCDGNENNKRGYDGLQKIDFAKKNVVEEIFNTEDELVRKYVLWRILVTNDVKYIHFLERCLYKESSTACYILWTLLHLGMKSHFLPKLYANKLFQEIILHLLVENLVENESLLCRVIASDLSDEKIRKYVFCIVKNHRFFYESALDHWGKIEDTSLKKAIVWLNMQHISLSKFVTNPWPLTIIDQEPDYEVKMYVVLGLYEHFYNKDILRAKYPADKRSLIVRLYRLLNLQCKNRTILGKKTAMIRKLIIAAAQKRELSEEDIKELVRQHIKDEVHNSILQFTKPQELDLSPPTFATVREIESCFLRMSYAHHRAMNLEEVEFEETIYETIEVEVEVEVPHTIGSYHILDIVGEGTYSVVYKAHRPDFPDIVALKVFEEIYDIEVFTKKLEKAKQTMLLQHPNIIRVDDFAQIDNAFCITMEYFHGVTIGYLVKKHGPISPEIVVQLALQIVNALEYAHNKGIMHENIRPSHILVNRKGVVKILDACLMELEYEIGKAMKSALGTISFLSPEQLEDMKSVSSQTDIFSLGGVLYFALTGVYPFGEEPLGKVIENILHNEPPPLSALVPDISFVLEETIMKCLAKKAAQRFSSIEELKQKLLSISQNQELVMNFEIRAKGKHYARQISQPQKIIVGRDEQCDIYICDDPLISRQHALINFAVNEITVTDLKSQNGVFINGERSYKKTVRLDDEIRIGRTVFYILVPQDNKCGECKRKILSSEIHEGKTLRRDKQIYCKTCFKPDVPKISSYQYKKARKGKIIKKTETKQQPKCVAKVKRLRYVNKTPEIPKPQICIIPDKKLEKSKMPEKVVAEAQTPSSPKVIGKWRNALKEMTSGKSTITEILHQVKQEEKMFVGETIASLLFDQWLRKEVDVALNATQFKISVEEKALREVEEISWQDRYKIQKKL